MSTRAIRALRGDDTSKLLLGGADAIEEEDSDDDESSVEPPKRSAFAFLGESDEESSSSSSSEEEDVSNSSSECKRETEENTKTAIAVPTTTAPQPHEEAEDDIDALLEEFQTQDAENELKAEGLAETLEASPFDAILHSFDSRDLDHDFSMRVTLLHETSTSRRKQQPLSFGSPRDGWVRPPRLVGGGMGMKTYADYEDGEQPSIPWPYNSLDENEADDVATATTQNQSRWFTFVHSEQNQRDRDDFADIIQSSGDINALGMFLAHHPYVTSALLQYSSVLYQSNRSNDGLALLRRCLWIYEVSMLMGFRDRIATGNSCCFMDSGREENVDFFESLSRLFRASYIAGYVHCPCLSA